MAMRVRRAVAPADEWWLGNDLALDSVSFVTVCLSPLRLFEYIKR